MKKLSKINRNKLIAFGLGVAFFVLGIFTLPNYGINWDTINHLPRGQAYLHYLLTGNKDYSDLEEYRLYWQKADTLKIDTDIPLEEVPTRSMYQLDATTYEWYMEHDGNGHPPASDILSSFFNRVLFGKFRLINDIDSYRVYGVLLAASLVGLVFYWTTSLFNKTAGLAASLALATYPLFWSESHFNTEKDIPETVFISFLLFSVWKGIKEKSKKWILFSGVFFGLALGTKFNVLFASLIVIPWFLIVWIYEYRKGRSKNLKKYLKNKSSVLATAVMAVLIGFSIFVLLWPYLWPDVIGRMQGVIGFYKTIGITKSFNPRFTGPLGINIYPLIWIFFTTPIVTLILFFAGVFASTKKLIKTYNLDLLLILIWFAIPVSRVVWPGTTVYGGIRQIMEYIPAMSILAGVGAGYFGSLLSEKFKLKNKHTLYLGVVVVFIPIVITLTKIHPNENVYFNQLIGGLSGAKKHDIPSWGNSFGAAYRQGVVWINENAEKNANVVYAYELIPNIPRIFFRQDLTLWNANRSGYLRQGEYAISLTYDGTSERSYYDTYLEKFIKPSYKVQVDGVPILKVWHNTEEDLKVDWKEVTLQGVELERQESSILLELPETSPLSRLNLIYEENTECVYPETLYVRISTDEESWKLLPGTLPRDWLIPVLGQQPKDGEFIHPFTGESAKYIEIQISPENSCLFEVEDFEVVVFEN